MKRIAPERFGILTSAVPHLIFPCRGRVSPPPSSPGLLQQLDGCLQPAVAARLEILIRSEERRVGKECRSRWSPSPYKKKKPALGVALRAMCSVHTCSQEGECANER